MVVELYTRRRGETSSIKTPTERSCLIYLTSHRLIFFLLHFIVEMAERKLNLSLFSIIILLLCAFHDSPGRFVVSDKSPVSISVGVVLDLEASVGRMSRPIISLALEDFYASHVDYRTRLQLHFRDSKEDIVVAASEGNREAVEKMVLARRFILFLAGLVLASNLLVELIF